MQWSEVVDNPYFQNLPFKIELNRYGKVEMTPASNQHGRLQLHIGALLERKLKKGEALTECSIQTTEGVKVADVAWCSKAFIKQYGYATPYPRAPELCVEIVSPSNSKVEMTEKVQLYLQAGAEEVWVVWENGLVDYYGKMGKLEQSGYGISLKIPKF
ncbi:MAG: Uma2 family endonuclease [Methylovulum sp.]|uniref:Uma2 family endonuclease n=1 Tax=Methylovulum sp. TaxID=1916980 RepID=UPI002621CE21|nr:Uma2 family endonuclease [Methylovulum sp.]MDD2724099.1 Uma2 family endonuclease [Methylovulum sp.]MDD5124725.1 Uma2 family endonuclease [Methylovulum sp.]